MYGVVRGSAVQLIVKACSGKSFVRAYTQECKRFQLRALKPETTAFRGGGVTFCGRVKVVSQMIRDGVPRKIMTTAVSHP